MFVLARLAAISLVLASLAIAPALAVPHAGDVAPPFSLARVTGGGTLSLAQLRGKATYVNFFASWCPPCNAEAPAIARLYRKYRSRGLTIVGIDELEDKGKAKDFASHYKWPFAVVLDDSGNTGRDYGALVLPIQVFIDKRGNVSTYRFGPMSPAEVDEAVRKIL